MEVAGFVIGVTSILGLLSTGLEIFDRVDTARSHATGISSLRTKLGNQKLQFEQWAEQNGFGTDRYNSYLDEPNVRPHIEATFDEIWLLLGQSDKLSARYGTSEPLATVTQADHPSSSEDRFIALTARLCNVQKNASIRKLMMWAGKDANKFSKIVTDLAHFVNDLYQMTGTSRERTTETQMHDSTNHPHVTEISSQEDQDQGSGYHERTRHVLPMAEHPPEPEMGRLALEEAPLDEDIYSASPPRHQTLMHQPDELSTISSPSTHDAEHPVVPTADSLANQ